MKHMSRRTLLAFLFLLPLPVRAQIPEHFTNLRVLPDTISRDELVETMRGFSFALGVRCSYCHTVSDQLGQPSDDFASDDKAPKQRARAMLRMVRAINDEYLAALPSRRDPPISVSCRTCHGGIPRPELLDDLLFRVVGDDGIAAGLARYAELKDRYYGGAAYDFGSRTLFLLGERLAGNGRPRDAIRVFEVILEEEPGSAEAWLNVGGAQAMAGDTAAAAAAYERVIELSPEGWAGTARRRLEGLRRGR